jgi:hypothetical protein
MIRQSVFMRSLRYQPLGRYGDCLLMKGWEMGQREVEFITHVVSSKTKSTHLCMHIYTD